MVKLRKTETLDKGLRVGRFLGVSIFVDWSWLLTGLLIIWTLALVFGEIQPNWGPGLRWGTALAASVLFLASVLAHELAHTLMARARGLSVRSITLFLFGGVSNLQHDPPSPRIEFLLSIIGPITSMVLGVIFIVLSGLGTAALGNVISNPRYVVAQLSLLATLLLWLGTINILVGVFNLMPGFPFDGGRIVRSIFWATTKDLCRATRWASWLGQAIAWVMIGVGAAMIFGLHVSVFGTGSVNGLWLVFIGWFLNSASAKSYQQVVVQDILKDVPVARLMRSDPLTVSPARSITDLVREYIMGTDDHAFPVLDDGRLVGLVTLEDASQVSPNKWNTTTVGEIMTPLDQLVSTQFEGDAAKALNKLRQRDVHQLPVLREGNLAGMLRRQDILRWLKAETDEV